MTIQQTSWKRYLVNSVPQLAPPSSNILGWMSVSWRKGKGKLWSPITNYLYGNIRHRKSIVKRTVWHGVISMLLSSSSKKSRIIARHRHLRLLNIACTAALEIGSCHWTKPLNEKWCVLYTTAMCSAISALSTRNRGVLFKYLFIIFARFVHGKIVLVTFPTCHRRNWILNVCFVF